MTNKKLSYRLETGRQQCISLFSVAVMSCTNVRHLCPIETADLLSKHRIDFSYAKMHATAARGLTRDTTVV